MGVFILILIQLLTTCAQTIIAHHQWSLVLSLLVSHYQLCVSIALQRAQAIMILQKAATLGRGSSFLSHIITNAPPSLSDLWQMTTFLFEVFFVIIDRQFVAMGPICIWFFLKFLLTVYFRFIFGLCLLVLSFALYF